MTDYRAGKRFRGTLRVEPGQPIAFDVEEDLSPSEDDGSAARQAIGRTLKAHRDAGRTLLEGQYAHIADVAPLQLRNPCDCTVIQCDDGIIVRWDRQAGEKPEIRLIELSPTASTIPEVATAFSEQFVHCVVDPGRFQLPDGCPRIQLVVGRSATGESQPIADVAIGLVVDWRAAVAHSFRGATRPTPIVSLGNQFEMQIWGEERAASGDTSLKTPRSFMAHTTMTMPTGWLAFEIHPPFDSDAWVESVGSTWAELDILACAARSNARIAAFEAIDPRQPTRRLFAALLDEFSALLRGAEEPLQAFLKANPNLLSPTHDRLWPKLPIGDHVTDFVFREGVGDYLLVELEAPSRRLFRKDGHPHHDLTHAIDQVEDWIRYIEDNLKTVQDELGLTGISTQPRALVVIGRDSSLTPETQRKLTTLQNTHPKLQILTYDQLHAKAHQTLENILGPLREPSPGVSVYYSQ